VAGKHVLFLHALQPARKGSYMKKLEKEMKDTEEEIKLRLRPRKVKTVSIKIPTDTLASLKKVASNRDMSYQALIKLYIGQGLRDDLAKLFVDRVLEKTS
jgi:predicted DNA binding CopG/RHH family protein